MEWRIRPQTSETREQAAPVKRKTTYLAFKCCRPKTMKNKIAKNCGRRRTAWRKFPSPKPTRLHLSRQTEKAGNDLGESDDSLLYDYKGSFFLSSIMKHGWIIFSNKLILIAASLRMAVDKWFFSTPSNFSHLYTSPGKYFRAASFRRRNALDTKYFMPDEGLLLLFLDRNLI